MPENPRSYCHDKDIYREAQNMGVTDPRVINHACGIGEGPYSHAYDMAMDYLYKHKLSQDNGKSPKTRLPSSQKRQILERYGFATYPSGRIRY